MTPTRLICPRCHEVFLLGDGCDCEREEPMAPEEELRLTLIGIARTFKTFPFERKIN